MGIGFNNKRLTGLYDINLGSRRVFHLSHFEGGDSPFIATGYRITSLGYGLSKFNRWGRITVSGCLSYTYRKMEISENGYSTEKIYQAGVSIYSSASFTPIREFGIGLYMINNINLQRPVTLFGISLAFEGDK